MFHTHVLAVSGTVVDFDRASLLMDKELLQAALDAMRDEQQNSPRHDARYGAQWVWDYYCQRHIEKFGEAFIPDVTPHWDSGRPDPNPNTEPSQPPASKDAKMSRS